MNRIPWADITRYHDVVISLREMADHTEIRVDSKTERLEVFIRKGGKIATYLHTYSSTTKDES